MTTNPIRFAIITLSDRAATGQRPDESGPLLKKILTEKLNAPRKKTIIINLSEAPKPFMNNSM